MTKEQKELLFKDISARLPYGVKCAEVYPDGNKFENVWDIIRISKYDEDGIHISNCKTIYGYCSPIENIKPYLFPMSSMTEEQFEEFLDICGWCGYIDEVRQGDFFNREENLGFTHIYGTMDWLNINHFDYRGLIDNGLAIDATGLNIY